jgi:hypothetical protein
MGVLTRRFIREHPSHLDVLQLAIWVLVKAADPDIADALTVQSMILIEFCQVELYGL